MLLRVATVLLMCAASFPTTTAFPISPTSQVVGAASASIVLTSFATMIDVAEAQTIEKNEKKKKKKKSKDADSSTPKTTDKPAKTAETNSGKGTEEGPGQEAYMVLFGLVAAGAIIKASMDGGGDDDTEAVVMAEAVPKAAAPPKKKSPTSKKKSPVSKKKASPKPRSPSPKPRSPSPAPATGRRKSGRARKSAKVFGTELSADGRKYI